MIVATLLFTLALHLGQEAFPDSIVLSDPAGKHHVALSIPEGKKLAAFVFVTNDCPISNAYAPEINRLVAEYGKKGVAFSLVHVDAALPRADAAMHAKEYGFKCRVLMDPKHLLVKRLEATITPEAAVVNDEGKLLYRGRIDDRYADLGKLRPARTKDLRNALDAALTGKPIPNPRTKAVGCLMPKTRERRAESGERGRWTVDWSVPVLR